MKDTVLEGVKKKSGKNLFRKLNEHSKNLRAKLEEIIKKHNSLVTQYEELEHLKVNINNYLGKTKTKDKAQLGGIRLKIRKSQKKEVSKETER